MCAYFTLILYVIFLATVISFTIIAPLASALPILPVPHKGGFWVAAFILLTELTKVVLSMVSKERKKTKKTKKEKRIKIKEAHKKKKEQQQPSLVCNRIIQRI